MDPMKIDVTEIREDLGAHVHVEQDVELDPIDVGQITFVLLAPARLDVFISNTGNGLVAQGMVAARFRTECSRCLEPFELEVEGVVDTFYADPAEAQLLDEDVDWEPIQAGTIDLAPAIGAAVLVDLPFAPVCTEECAGICPTCGANLNESSCECVREEPPAASPFSTLKGLFPGEEG